MSLVKRDEISPREFIVWRHQFHSSLELGMFFLEEATSLSLGDKTISFLMFTPTVYVP